MAKRINSKAKGSTFERKVAKELSKWSGEEFHRTPMSGALKWSNDKRVISDIVAPNTLLEKGWCVSLEIKNVETSWEFSNLLQGTSLTLNSHWVQCTADAEKEGMTPLLIFTKNYRDTFVMMEKSLFSQLNLEKVDHLEVHTEETLCILTLENLLKNTKVEDFCKKN